MAIVGSSNCFDRRLIATANGRGAARACYFGITQRPSRLIGGYSGKNANGAPTKQAGALDFGQKLPFWRAIFLRRVGIFGKSAAPERQFSDRVGMNKIAEILSLTGFSGIGMPTEC